MTNVLKEAMAEVASLPVAAQEKIGEELLLHVDKLRRLRAKLEKGIQSLDQGKYREVDINDIIKRAHAQHE